MKSLLSKYLAKFFFQQWTIGITRGSLKDIIKNKSFDPDISWFPVKSKNIFRADPFLFKSGEGKYHILYEEYAFKDKYGIISMTEIDRNFRQSDHKILLDTNSHLSYPFIYTENNQVYVFPESAQSGKLSCYEYDPANKCLKFLKEIIELPLLDSTILRYNNIYWLFATLKGKDEDNKLVIFFSNNLLGPYTPHPKNPVKTGLEGSRPAGNFIVIDDEIYRPAQNSKYTYGGGITINKIIQLNEMDYREEFYMPVNLSRNNRNNTGMHAIHTINTIDDIIVVDGTKWRFSPAIKLKQLANKLTSKRNKD